MGIVIGIIVVLVVVTVFKSIVIVPQKQACIVERLGKYHCTLEAGFHMLVPFIDTVRYRQNLKEIALDVPPQQCITKDNIAVDVDGILYMQVMDPAKASYGIGNYRDIIDARARDGWRYVGFLPTRQRGTGHMQELDLIFEKEEKPE